MPQLFDSTLFNDRVGYNLLGHNLIYTKMVTNDHEFRMVGSQINVKYKDPSTSEELREFILEGLRLLLNLYGYTGSNVNHLIITIVPINQNLITKFKSLEVDNKVLNKHMEDNLHIKSVIPVSINPDFIGTELIKQCVNGKISDVLYVNDDKVKVSLAKQFALNSKLSSLSTYFQFYSVILNGIKYILGVNKLNQDSVRKLRLTLSGNIIEDITDTVLPNGCIQRKSRKDVYILRGDIVVESYKNISISPIPKPVSVQQTTENANIGVIDFETLSTITEVECMPVGLSHT